MASRHVGQQSQVVKEGQLGDQDVTGQCGGRSGGEDKGRTPSHLG